MKLKLLMKSAFVAHIQYYSVFSRGQGFSSFNSTVLYTLKGETCGLACDFSGV